MIDIDSYLIHIEGGPPTNYGAYSPDVLGCVAVGETIEECLEEMRSALAFHLEGMLEDGEEIPKPSGPGVYVRYDQAA
jgi:predicted RNase H-like HicB family nuclease